MEGIQDLVPARICGPSEHSQAQEQAGQDLEQQEPDVDDPKAVMYCPDFPLVHGAPHQANLNLFDLWSNLLSPPVLMNQD
jgi:hypothetical protein